MRKGGFNTNDVKEVFRIYDWQKPRREQDPEVLDRIEVLLRLKDAPWNGPNTRSMLLGDKVHAILTRVMRRHGWITGAGYCEEDTWKMRQYFAPVNRKSLTSRL
jgi:hypothetical protein